MQFLSYRRTPTERELLTVELSGNRRLSISRIKPLIERFVVRGGD